MAEHMGTACLLALALASALPAPPPDGSLTPTEYVALGMAAPDRTWSPADYETAAIVLEKLTSEDASRLPRYGSERSGKVFARFVAAGDMATFIANAPPSQRVPFAVQMMLAAKRIAFAYIDPASRGMVMDRELAECQGLLLATGAQASETLDEFLARLPSDDPNRAQREKGLEQVRSGFSQMLSGALLTLTEHATYREESRRSLALSVRAYAPRLLKHMSELQRLESRRRIDQLVPIEQDSLVRQSLVATQIAIGALEAK
jgi:hypothetical protein